MTRMAKIQTSSWTFVMSLLTASRDERDQRHAGDAVGLKAVGRGSDRVARALSAKPVQSAITPGLQRIVFLNLECDLHQIRANIGDLGKDAACHAQCGSAQRFADREPDEAGPRVIARYEQQDAQHDEQLDADQHHADAHTGLQRDRVTRERLAPQARECRPRIRECIHSDAEPRHAVAAGDAH